MGERRMKLRCPTFQKNGRIENRPWTPLSYSPLIYPRTLRFKFPSTINMAISGTDISKNVKREHGLLIMISDHLGTGRNWQESANADDPEEYLQSPRPLRPRWRSAQTLIPHCFRALQSPLWDVCGFPKRPPLLLVSASSQPLRARLCTSLTPN